MKIQIIFFFLGGGGGSGGRVGLGVGLVWSGGCERRNEAFVKIQKKKNRGGGGGSGPGGRASSWGSGWM